MDETTVGRQANKKPAKTISAHKGKLAACAAVVALTAMLGGSAVFAGNNPPATNPLMTPVADLSGSDQS